MFKVGVGRALSAVPALLMLFSAAMKFNHAPALVADWTGKFGFPESTLSLIGVFELLCVVFYLIPRTAVFGAVLMTGYLGGAVATHVRVGDAPAMLPALIGVVAWGGLYFRDERVRALIPFVKPRE